MTTEGNKGGIADAGAQAIPANAGVPGYRTPCRWRSRAYPRVRGGIGGLGGACFGAQGREAWHGKAKGHEHHVEKHAKADGKTEVKPESKPEVKPVALAPAAK